MLGAEKPRIERTDTRRSGQLREGIVKPRERVSGLRCLQLRAIFPKLFWFENPRWRYDTGNELGGSNIETGIERGAAGIGDLDVLAPTRFSNAPCAENFRFASFLDGNIVS